ncbi:hypothetical protein phytr_3070 [Candidatus Phycorickettsia trachydisci]|uniref:Uncharacterized protein n=1 Tax=Candidatus Phycorickettsia trachydisci TaxID=2115978 RepID=A0A2P1P7M0_9RICK|nr:ankyrin repeat domain-containing protein [Candidatus Phycorickettsia trachydisci]AVP87261.1 hypothetical protein phytr_3070 [Candidatus Phycorickettsia trachydisci]
MNIDQQVLNSILIKEINQGNLLKVKNLTEDGLQDSEGKNIKAEINSKVVIGESIKESRYGSSVKILHKSTPLFESINKGHVEIIQYLLEQGADVRCTNSKNLNALDLVSNLSAQNPYNQGFKSILSLILKQGPITINTTDVNSLKTILKINDDSHEIDPITKLKNSDEVYEVIFRNKHVEGMDDVERYLDDCTENWMQQHKFYVGIFAHITAKIQKSEYKDIQVLLKDLMVVDNFYCAQKDEESGPDEFVIETLNLLTKTICCNWGIAPPATPIESYYDYFNGIINPDNRKGKFDRLVESESGDNDEIFNMSNKLAKILNLESDSSQNFKDMPLAMDRGDGYNFSEPLGENSEKENEN